MGNSRNILQELKQISPLVAEINAGNPYQTPQDYFEGLAAEILNRISIIEETPVAIKGAPHKTPFTTPPDYFEHLSKTVLSRIRAMEAGSPKEELEALSPILGQLEKKIPFSVPSGYFDELSMDVLAGATAIDFVNRQFDPVSPLLNEARDKNVYTVPAGYFDQLSGQIIKKARHGQRPKLISLKVSKRLFRYAAAAAITGMVALGAWLFFQPEPLPGSGNEFAAIETLSDDEIVDYLDNNTVTIPENSSIASFDLKEEDLKELLSDVSDQELQQYLDQHAVAKDVTIN
ncbi:MAG: hypothetical protein WKF97_26365 [Chitinophagaceae bacterium]